MAPHEFSFACSSVERRCGHPVRPESWRRRRGPERTMRPNLSFRLTEVRPRKRRALRRGTLRLEIGCSPGFLKGGRRSFPSFIPPSAGEARRRDVAAEGGSEGERPGGGGGEE